MNTYALLSKLSADLRLASTVSRDADLMNRLENSSRAADTHCQRHFFVEGGTRIFTASTSREVIVDDLLSVSSLVVDSEGDGTFDGQTWIEGEADDFVLLPDNRWPRTKVLATGHGQGYTFPTGRRAIKITGNWGFGTGRTATPYQSSGINVTVDDSNTSLGLSAEGRLEPGHSILVEDEQMFVTAASSDGSKTATVEREVNGTAAAEHAAAVAAISLYPSNVVRWVLWHAANSYRRRGESALTSERLGNFSHRFQTPEQDAAFTTRVLGRFTRNVVG